MQRFLASMMAVVVAAGLAGCSSTTAKPAEGKTDKYVAQDAPLGSRIKKKSGAAPVAGATRDDIERSKFQQGAIETRLKQQNP